MREIELIDGKQPKPDSNGPRPTRREVMEAVRAAAPPKDSDLPAAARSQDFLYDEDGLPK
jgi:hypothetical protein